MIDELGQMINEGDYIILTNYSWPGLNFRKIVKIKDATNRFYHACVDDEKRVSYSLIGTSNFLKLEPTDRLYQIMMTMHNIE